MTAMRTFTPDPTTYNQFLVKVMRNRYDPDEGTEQYPVWAIGGTGAEKAALNLAQRDGYTEAVVLSTSRTCNGCGLVEAPHAAHTGPCGRVSMNADTVQLCQCTERQCPRCSYDAAIHDPSCPTDEADAVDRWGRAS